LTPASSVIPNDCPTRSLSCDKAVVRRFTQPRRRPWRIRPQTHCPLHPGKRTSRRGSHNHRRSSGPGQLSGSDRSRREMMAGRLAWRRRMFWNRSGSDPGSSAGPIAAGRRCRFGRRRRRRGGGPSLFWKVDIGISGQMCAEGARNESDGFRRRSHHPQSAELILPACRGDVQTSSRPV